MQRIANSSSPVQLWNAPPLKTSFYPPLLLSPSAIFNCFNSYKWNYCFCLTLVLLLLSQSNFFSFSSLSSFFSVRGRNYVPPICNSQLFVFLVVIFLLPNLASFYVTRLVLTPTLGGGCYFGLDWFYSFH